MPDRLKEGSGDRSRGRWRRVGHLACVPRFLPQPLMVPIHQNVTEHGKAVTGVHTIEMRPSVSGQSTIAASRLLQGKGIAYVRNRGLAPLPPRETHHIA